MNFNSHSDLVGEHAFLSASKYHWINYTEEKLSESYLKYLAIERGTRLHKFAQECIELGIKLPKTKKSLNMYVNDAIGFRMIPEQPLFYSVNAFGTADSISFKDDLLRIHDLKTGASPTSMHQLEVYAALFCLEYAMQPSGISMELRIYQSDDVMIHIPENDMILSIMDKIITFDKRIEFIRSEE
jgi:hypothetical protein